MNYLLFGLGLIALFFGGEYLVRGASGIARHFRLSPMVIGLTIVGFGTSTPELLVSVQAALAGTPAIAIGNVLGSNIANILLILVVSALVAPLAIAFRDTRRDMATMLAATAAVWVMLADGEVSRLDGMLLALGLAGFLAMSFLTGSAPPDDEGDVDLQPLWRQIAVTLGGLVTLMVGARLLVDSATDIARTFGISEAVIGLTIVAVGTSLQELATSVIAALRKETEIAVGNIVGSNIFNILGILALTALVAPIPADPRFAEVDMPWVAGVAVALVALAAAFGGLNRWAGAGLLTGYAGYLGLTGF